MTALALAGRLVTTAGILDGGVLEVRLDGTIGYVGLSSGWSGPVPEPVDTVAPGYVDIHCHGGGSHTFTSRDPAEVAAVAAHHLAGGRRRRRRPSEGPDGDARPGAARCCRGRRAP